MGMSTRLLPGFDWTILVGPESFEPSERSY
jgi:hypothetical protein